MAPDDIISRLTSLDGDSYLCSSCLQRLDSMDTIWNTAHLTFSGFLEAVANKCFICRRLFQTLDSTCQECFKTLARYEHLKKPSLRPGSSDLMPVTYLSRRKVDQGNGVDFELTLFFGESCYKREKWNFNPETLPDLAHAIGAIRSFNTLRASNSHHGPALNFRLIGLAGGPKALETLEWIKSCAGTGNSMAWEETTDLMRKWLQACASSHEQCIHRASDPTWFPTRVLDLGPSDPAMSDKTAVKIVKREQVIPGNRYVTLSHRWTPSIPKLTSQNLVAWSRRLPVDTLTKTFRDFITVSRLLGFRYAWIDSLCIIQESDHGGSDWSHECLMMHLIYRNSFCNFSADWSTNPNEGLFLDRRARQFDCPMVNFVSKPEIKWLGRTGGFYGHLLVDTSTWQHEVTQSPINSRGWVFQERFLSPRVIHFCPNEVFFECCEVSRSERFRQSLSAIDAVAFEPFKNCENSSSGMCNIVAGHRVWDRVPGVYSRCALTFPSDKLVAISGIARYLKAFLGDDVYIMGVWASAITAQMLWQCEENRIRNDTINPITLGRLEPRAASEYQALSTPLSQRQGPTFSWISTDLPVNLLKTTGRYHCEDARFVKYREGQTPSDDEPITEDIFDYPRGPTVELRVTGLLYRARLIDDGDRYLSVIFIDQTNTALQYDGRSISIKEGNVGPALMDFAINPSEIPGIESRIFFYMPWGMTGVDSDSEVGSSSILLELVNREMGRFRRIGIIRHGLEDLKSMSEGNGGDESLPCYYDPETQKHTIYII